MNPLTNFEIRLRGFRPRPPSPRVERALFGPPAGDTAPRAHPPGFWLAPLAAVGVLVLTIATAWSPGGGPASASYALAAPPGTWDAEPGQIERNAPPRPDFRSTTAAPMASSFGSLLLRHTNVFAR